MITVREDARRRESRWWVICPEHDKVTWTWTQRGAKILAEKHEKHHAELAAIDAALAETMEPCENCEETVDHECVIDGVVYGPYPKGSA